MSTCQQKMNDNNVISFYILKELLNSFQTSGNEFWDNKRFSRYRETIIAKTFNENDVITEKCWRTLKNEVIMKIFGPILITFIIVPNDFSQGLLEVPDVLGGWGYFLLPSPHNHWMSNWKPNQNRVKTISTIIVCKFLKYNTSNENFYNQKDSKFDGFVFLAVRYLFKVISKSTWLMRSILYLVCSKLKIKISEWFQMIYFIINF